MNRILKPEVQARISELDDEMRIVLVVMTNQNFGGFPAGGDQSHLKMYTEKKKLKSSLIADRKNWICIGPAEHWATS
jgi:hypothetical protein